MVYLLYEIKRKKVVLIKTVKGKKQIDCNNRIKNELSMKFGVSAYLVLLMTLFLDTITIFVNEIPTAIWVMTGFFALIVTILIIKVEWLHLFPNKNALRSIIDIGTFISVIVFSAEKIMTDYTNNLGDKVSLIFIYVCCWTLNVGTWIIAVRKKDWKYNID